MKSYTYLVLDLSCIAIPLICSFYKRYPFYKEWKIFLPANMIVAIFFLIWDDWFTQNGIWGFNPDYLMGIYLGHLPLEEILFFTCIPYACVFTYFAISKLIKNTLAEKKNRWIIFVLFSILVIFMAFFYEKKYTFYTAFFLSLLLLYALYKKLNLSLALLSYLIILPFFFISNGILTGSWIEKPIVWYNDAENVAFRILTIPIEDVFYGLTLILGNILMYERIKRFIHRA